MRLNVSHLDEDLLRRRLFPSLSHAPFLAPSIRDHRHRLSSSHFDLECGHERDRELSFVSNPTNQPTNHTNRPIGLPAKPTVPTVPSTNKPCLRSPSQYRHPMVYWKNSFLFVAISLMMNGRLGSILQMISLFDSCQQFTEVWYRFIEHMIDSLPCRL